VSATDEAGRLFETNVTDGQFQLGLTPGTFKIQFDGSEAIAVIRQLEATIEIKPDSTSASVELTATQVNRKMRQTLFLDKGS
jgi:hypothetical protein